MLALGLAAAAMMARLQGTAHPVRARRRAAADDRAFDGALGLGYVRSVSDP